MDEIKLHTGDIEEVGKFVYLDEVLTTMREQTSPDFAREISNVRIPCRRIKHTLESEISKWNRAKLFLTKYNASNDVHCRNPEIWTLTKQKWLKKSEKH